MATRYWKPRTVGVAQVDTGSIDSVDATPANNTFTVTIGGVEVSEVGDTDVATTATNLRATLNASTHPYFAAIAWSGTTGDIIGTAGTAGVPFEAALTETGAGTGTVTDFAATTASAGPNDVGDALNWSGETLPGASDDIVVQGGSTSLLWRLESIADAVSLTVYQSFTGAIGLSLGEFLTSADGTTDSTAPEYRTSYLRCELDDVVIGRDDGLGRTGIGSPLVKIHNDKAGASLLRVENTASDVAGNKPAVRYLADNSLADVEVLSAPGAIGIAIDEPGETATIGDMRIVDSSTESAVVLGPGTTITTWEQQGGQNVLNAAATVNNVTVFAGTLDIIGADYLINTLEIRGGTVVDSHVNSAGNEWTNLLLYGGVVDLTDTQQARTIGALHPDGGTISASWDDLTVTTNDLPDGLKSVTIGDV